MMAEARVIVALDFADAKQALDFAGQVSAEQCKLKVGKELFTAAGPDLVRKLVDQGFDVFVDLKYHDIPNTVKRACTAASNLGAWMVNVHALGGSEMMQAAREGIDAGSRQSLLIAVTVLTSMNQAQLDAIGLNRPVSDLVVDLTASSLESGLDGVVCSAKENTVLRQQFGQKPVLVTPGIRPAGSEAGDQKRIVTPDQAIADGSSYLVIGRPITQHQDPASALLQINESISC